MDETPLLAVRGLRIGRAGSPAPPLVDSLSFDVGAERVALVGESGSGKSLTARAIAGLLPVGLAAHFDRLDLFGEDWRERPARDWRRLRGARLSLVLQDARHALNPALPVRRQIDEILLLHGERDARQRHQRALEALHAVGLADAARVLDAFAHELSGGIAQRVMLAMMLANRPRLVIADEPTSALDAELRDQVLDLLSCWVQENRMGLLLISHDLPLVARTCDRALILYQGRLVDACPADRLAHCAHPYTRTLWRCRPSAATYGTALPVLDRAALGAGGAAA